MTNKERFDNLTERLGKLPMKESSPYISMAKTILSQVNSFIDMDTPPELNEEVDLLIVEGLNSAENLIKKVEAKSP